MYFANYFIKTSKHLLRNVLGWIIGEQFDNIAKRIASKNKYVMREND
jgi:hypothetical protein